jgi:hypothetical protein
MNLIIQYLDKRGEWIWHTKSLKISIMVNT